MAIEGQRAGSDRFTKWGEASMKKRTTINVRFINADKTGRELEVQYRDLNIVESEFGTKYPLKHGERTDPLPLEVDAQGVGATAWRAQGSGLATTGVKRDLEDRDDVEVWLEPPAKVEERAAPAKRQA
jgi:hypothetical protein